MKQRRGRKKKKNKSKTASLLEMKIEETSDNAKHDLSRECN